MTDQTPTFRSSPKEKILVVDDAEATRFLFSKWLRRVGYEVHEAASGEEALELLARIGFDLALLDIHLPDMSGYAISEHIKAHRATSAIPVLHVSATATGAADRSEGLLRGADAYLCEPMEQGELLSTVAALLRIREARKASELLAARLEQLHQTTLLVSSTSSLSELVNYAASGSTAIFASGVLIVATRGGIGWAATAEPGGLGAHLEPCAPEVVLEIAESTTTTLTLSGVAHLVGAIQPQQATALMTPRGELVGAVVLLSGSPVDQIGLMLDHLAQALAVAIENQRLFEVEHRIALTLQKSMLPRSIPHVPGLEIDVRYEALSDTAEIGGDFYEIIEVGPSKTLFAIGDVMGHSLEAATVMAELRYSLRAFASLRLQPEEILERLNNMLRSSKPRFSATLCIVVFDLELGELRVTNAGHMPPYVRQGLADKGHFVERHGSLLGFVGRSFPTVRMDLHPGALVVLFTDGLIERRGESVDDGLARLAAAVDDFEGPIVALSDELVARVGAGENAIDDLALVLARWTPITERDQSI